MDSERRAIPDPVLPSEDLSTTIQNAVDALDELYGRISNPLARDHLKRNRIKDFIALVAVSHEELQRRLDASDAERSGWTPVDPETVTTEKVEGVMAHLGEAISTQPIATFEPATSSEPEPDAPTSLPFDFVSEHVAGLLRAAGFYTLESVDSASDSTLLDINGIGRGFLVDIRAAVSQMRGEE